MERKIGEIFEYNGEWYQCVESSDCPKCDLKGFNNCNIQYLCSVLSRKDGNEVIFKKLEKVGEPFKRNGYLYQEYKAHTYPLLMNGEAKLPTANGFAVKIKQNKEDMEEKNKAEGLPLLRLVGKYMNSLIDYATFEKAVKDLYSNKEESKPTLKEFDLEAAKKGKPVCTRDGRKARIICFDRVTNSTNEYTGHLIVLVTNLNGDEQSFYYTEKGNLAGEDEYDNHKWDLMMLTEKKEGWVNLTGSLSHNPHILDVVWDTKEEALDFRRKAPINANIIATGKITWEE